MDVRGDARGLAAAAKKRNMEVSAVRGALAVAMATGTAILATGTFAFAAAPYEPNDGADMAFGPLTGGVPYAAALETTNDQDVYYVCTQRGAQQVEIGFRNTTPSGETPLELALYDAEKNQLTSTDYDGVMPGESEVLPYTLPQAGKYYLQVLYEPLYHEAFPVQPSSYDFVVQPPEALSTSLQQSCSPFPAKFKVRRAKVDDGQLDMLVRTTARANGDTVEFDFHANGRHHTFTETIEDGTLNVREFLPSSQEDVRTGIVTMTYGGNEYVRPTTVRLRAARVKANLERGELTLRDGKLTATGSISSRARGVVRLRLSYLRANGSVGEWAGRAKIDSGRWQLSEQLPAEAQGGGYLTMQFTGYLPRRMRGEQEAKQVLPE